jgi:hypothetical protein
MNTPWGHSQQTEQLAEGIVQVFTSSHGGIRLSEERQAAVHKAWRAGAPDTAGRWYEEDCEWAIVAATFPEAFDADDVASAHESLKAWYPYAYMRVFGVKLTAEDSYKLAEDEFYAAHADDWVANAAWGEWQVGVPAGMVGVLATRGGRGNPYGTSRAWFVVPKAEYDARNISFVIDVARHEEVDDFTSLPATRRAA